MKPEDEQRYQGDELEYQASQGAKESEVSGVLACALLTRIPHRDPEHSLVKSRVQCVPKDLSSDPDTLQMSKAPAQAGN